MYLFTLNALEGKGAHAGGDRHMSEMPCKPYSGGHTAVFVIIYIMRQMETPTTDTIVASLYSALPNSTNRTRK